MTKKYVSSQGIKDESGIYVKAAPDSIPPKPPEDPKLSDISLEDLLEKQLLVLYREIRNLLLESSTGPLSKESSQALVNYLKLTKDLLKEESELLSKYSNEELEAKLDK